MRTTVVKCTVARHTEVLHDERLLRVAEREEAAIHRGRRAATRRRAAAQRRRRVERRIALELIAVRADAVPHEVGHMAGVDVRVALSRANAPDQSSKTLWACWTTHNQQPARGRSCTSPRSRAIASRAGRTTFSACFNELVLFIHSTDSFYRLRPLLGVPSLHECAG